MMRFWKANVDKLISQKDKKGLISLLKNTVDSSAMEKARGALIRIGKPAVQPLTSALRKKDSILRYNAVDILRYIKSAETIQPLLLASRDKVKHIRSLALLALSEKSVKNNPDVYAVAAKALNDEEPEVRYHGAALLGRVDDKQAVPLLIKRVKDSNKSVRQAAVNSLGSLGDQRAVPHLIKAVHWKDLRAHVLDALVEIRDPRSIEILHQMLKDKDEGIRQKALKALGVLLGREELIELSISLLKDDGMRVREEAVRLLESQDWTAPNVPDKLLFYSANDRFVDLAKEAVADLDPYISLLRHKDVNVRKNAVKFFGCIVEKRMVDRDRVVEPLILACHDADRDVSYGAIKALAKLKDNRAVEPLIKLLDGKHGKVAAEALGKIGNPKAVLPLIQHGPFIDALVEIGEASIDPLISLLAHKNKQTVEAASIALSKLRAHRAVDSLIPLLYSSDENVSDAVLEALKRIGGNKARQALEDYYDR
jgi:HEAT repeat protein